MKVTLERNILDVNEDLIKIKIQMLI